MDTIRVWPFDRAPKAYQELRPGGGLHDWIALVPVGLPEEPKFWSGLGEHRNCCDISRHQVQGQRSAFVLVGIHA